ncbi:hypothetical protein QFC22_000216 [Naganishia vaughanmartiniae]|uniref:Uncharacterized protein n=1 Tax=Naganishia vaughanmartiniae TaxID=1424756 RepID=A0ACC2XQG9_9TREE|nr:hypothetical protein QFC22_000216 [Naganishia vaughanmartiniae]
MDTTNPTVQNLVPDTGVETGSKSPLEGDSDVDLGASSSSVSEFLEGSWATLSSEEVTSSQLEDLGSSDDGDKDSTGNLSPHHASSVVLSDSEFEPFSDSAYESEELDLPTTGRTYEYVTDQSWTDPDKSTPSHSTLCTEQGSFSRGLGNARTPAHSKASTLTREYLTQLSRYQPADFAEVLEDSQVELVFPRLPGEFGTGSTDTITSTSPLLSVQAQIDAAPKSRSKHHNFRDCSDQQSSEDDYIVLTAASSQPSPRPITRRPDDTAGPTPAAHHAFPTYPLDSRRGDKQGLEFVGGLADGIDQRGKRSFESKLSGVSNNQHAERSGKKHKKPQQKQYSEYPIKSIAQRVLDPDQNGYQRLSLGLAADSTGSFPADDFCDFIENVDARLIGSRTTWPVDQSWLDALSLARSQGLIMVDEPNAFSEDSVLSFSSVSLAVAPSTAASIDRDDAEKDDMAASDATVKAKDTSRITASANNALPHSGRMETVKKIALVASTLLALAVFGARSWSDKQDGSLKSQSSTGEQRASETFSSATVFVTCSTAMQDSGNLACYQCTQVKIEDIPVTSPVQSSHTSSATEASITTSPVFVAATPLSSSKDLSIVYFPEKPIKPVLRKPVRSEPDSTTLHNWQGDQSHGDGYTRCVRPKPTTQTPVNANTGRGTAGHHVKHINPRTMLSIAYGTSNASFLATIIETSLAWTTAIDHAFNNFHHGLVNMGHRLGDTVWTPHRVRNSGRRFLFHHQGSRFFNETDAIKNKVKSEMSDLLANVDQHLQALTIEMNKAVKETRKNLIIAIRDAADAVEKHVGVEIPLPSFVSRDNNCERKKSTVSTWAEKFWQTIHHATVTLVI